MVKVLPNDVLTKTLDKRTAPAALELDVSVQAISQNLRDNLPTQWADKALQHMKDDLENIMVALQRALLTGQHWFSSLIETIAPIISE